MAMAKPITLICFSVLLLLSNPVFSQLDEFFYNGFKDHNKNMSMNGVAEIENNGILRLTNDTRRLIGHAFYPFPLQFKNTTSNKAFSFSTAYAIAIVPEYPKLGGHGLAFTISSTKEFQGALPSQYLGLLNSNKTGNFSSKFFAVEFDTVQDFEFGDINDNHVGIDINSLTSNISASAAYYTDDSTKKDLNLKSGKVIQTWVDYDSVRNLLNVTISPFSKKPISPLISFQLDLSPVLLNSMYVGFSASTGVLASSHYLLGWKFKMFTSGSPDGSLHLDLSSLPSLPEPRKSRTVLITGVSVAAVLFFILAISLALFLFRKIKNADVIEAWELDLGPHRFSYKEIKLATKNFREKGVLGFGGFGKVYKGILPNSKTEVAIKRISNESKQGLREFVSEIASIGRLRHRNLVQLLGWCRKRSDLLLVYDFMPNGSLDKFLFDKPKSALSWEQRFKIIKGVASGLLYLHEEWEQVVVHRDVKASNVLLDSELNGRLGDFGLARLYEHGANPNTTRVVGTLGYLAPELTRTGKGTTSTDVFAFGALLLEVVCGRRPIEPKATPEELILVDWIWDMWQAGRPFDVVDSKMNGDYDEGEVVLVVKLGLMCSNCAPAVRPSMRQVVRYLEGEGTLPEVLSAPGEYEKGKSEVGFDDYVHSYPSSSFEKVNSYSFTGAKDTDMEGSSASPLSLLSGRGDSG